MCGRFTLAASANTLAEQFALPVPRDLRPRYNIAPGTPILAVRQGADGRRQWSRFRWGLVPSWAKDPSMGHRLINARAETVAEKPAFRAAFRRRRCLVPADGFFEWRAENGRKQPYYFDVGASRPVAIAGLWESWRGADGAVLESCVLLTTQANSLVSPIHPRMPVILPADVYSAWLDPDAAAQPPLVAYPPERMNVWPVDTRVNSPVSDDADCIRPANAGLPLDG